MKRFFYLMLTIAMLISCDKEAKQVQDVEKIKLKAEINLLQTKIEQDSINCVSIIDTLVLNKTCKEYNYYIVVGAFRNIERAQKWADKVDQLGYTSCIVHSHNDFEMVYVKGGEDLKTAIKIMENVRERITPRAWVYINRN